MRQVSQYITADKVLQSAQTAVHYQLKSHCFLHKNIKKNYKALKDLYLDIKAVKNSDSKKIFKKETNKSEDTAIILRLSNCRDSRVSVINYDMN